MYDTKISRGSAFFSEISGLLFRDFVRKFRKCMAQKLLEEENIFGKKMEKFFGKIPLLENFYQNSEIISKIFFKHKM
jgi:hypothetical protein